MVQSSPPPISLNGRKLAGRLLSFQTLAVIVIAIIFGLFSGLHAAVSAILGGLVVIVPNFVFSAFAFRHGGARSAHQIMRSFYAGEALKVTLCALLLALVLVFTKSALLPLYSSFVIVILMHWLTPILFLKSN